MTAPDELRRRVAGEIEPTTYGQRLRRARTAAGMTLGVLARRLGISAAQLSGVEMGRLMFGMGTEYRACECLGITPEWLRNGDHPPRAGEG